MADRVWVTLDAAGFVQVGTAAGHGFDGRQAHTLEPSTPGVFAVGDVWAGSVKRVASAVGEGSVVVSSVRQVLAGA